MTINLPNRQRLLVILAGAVVALFVLNSILVEPLTKMWHDHTLEIERLEKSVGNGRNTIARAKQTERAWSDMKKNALPEDAAQGQQDIYSALDRWGKANNVEFTSIRPAWKRGTTDKSSLLEFRVDAVGSLATLSHFIYEIEQSPLALRVDSVELTSRDDTGQKLTLGLVVSGLRLLPLERKQQ